MTAKSVFITLRGEITINPKDGYIGVEVAMTEQEIKDAIASLCHSLAYIARKDGDKKLIKEGQELESWVNRASY